MAYGITTPNLATDAGPYYSMVRAVMNDPYEFKNTVRSDFLKDQYVPAKQMDALSQYLDGLYSVYDRQNTMGNDLRRSYDESRVGAMNAADDVVAYPEQRRAADGLALTNAYDDIEENQQRIRERRDQILFGEASNTYQTILEGVRGVDYLDNAARAYDIVINDPTSGRAIRQLAENGVVQAAQQMLALSVPGTEEFERARQTLMRFYQYGTAVTPNNPAVSPRLSYGPSYGVPGGAGRVPGAAPSAVPGVVPAPSAGGWSP